eukprot:NODE_3496_length_779_cov_191.732044.p2 GENE.NODE_3496_length_779_cov_191.732044~~NODE_3496_length_779_cov_191.732044.p2  ORF type:complete len:88 (-),score=41.39 NODE_3496_length_779_cov_191.732044:3-266(-)
MQTSGHGASAKQPACRGRFRPAGWPDSQPTGSSVDQAHGQSVSAWQRHTDSQCSTKQPHGIPSHAYHAPKKKKKKKKKKKPKQQKKK